MESEYLKSSLNLHKLLYFVRPTIGIFEVLTVIVKTIHKSNFRGDQILTFLYNHIVTLSGIENAQKIVIHLTEVTAIPYIEMLQLWILKGIIIDPTQEFLVQDNEVIHQRADVLIDDHYSAEYWEKRYTLRQKRIPKFFQDQADKILRAGKYLNVIRQCGVTQPMLVNPQNADMKFLATDSTSHTVFIQNAYTFASHTLLKVLVKDNDLMGHLLSVKRYLLLHQGDFINQFMDASEKELSKNVDKVLPMRLENLLGLTLRVSSTKYDKYNDDLHCQIFPFELVKQMEKIHLVGSNEEGLNYLYFFSTNIFIAIMYFLEYWQGDKINLSGLECFAFRYEVRWPISLVLNHFAILEYQMLFRQLFYCKHVERQLCK